MTFGTALRAWRTRRSLSQERLAAAAGTVARHVSRLETGRAHPSAAMVRALAGALDVPPGGVEDLLVAAGHAPRPAAVLPPPPGPALLAEIARLLDAHEPYPAFALDPAWCVVAHNAAAGRLLACLGPDALVDGHALRVALHPSGLVGLATDDAPWRAALLARAADQAAAMPSARLSQELGAWGGPVHSPAYVAFPVRLRLPLGDVTLLAVSTRLAVPEGPAAAGLTIDALLPADEESRRVLDRAAVSVPRRA